MRFLPGLTLDADPCSAGKSISVASENAQVEEWLELNNGCLCCSVRDTGLNAILTLMEQKGRFDQIVLETTGLADPAPIIEAFWNEPALCIDVALDAVVAVVDAAGIEKVCDVICPLGLSLTMFVSAAITRSSTGRRVQRGAASDCDSRRHTPQQGRPCNIRTA